MMDPLPNIAKVFSYIVQQERQLASNDIMGNTNLFNAINTNSSNSRNSCTYCGKDNHTLDRCLLTHKCTKLSQVVKYSEVRMLNPHELYLYLD